MLELTSRGSAGISVLRVDGADAAQRVRALCPRARLRPGVPVLAQLELDGRLADECLVLQRADTRIELHLTGSPALVARVRRALGGGERSEPADLEARAARALAHAPSEAGARILLDQAQGALRRELEALFAEADAPTLERRIGRLVEHSRIARRALEPTRIVLAGPVNAGKSSLFNLLLGERRAITSDTPGTTRDLLIERAQIGPWPLELIDGAGDRAVPASSQAGVEQAGQELARLARAEADLVLWLRPAGSPAPAADPQQARVVTLLARADELEPAARVAPWVAPPILPEESVQAVRAVFETAFDLPADPWEAGRAIAFDEPGRALLAGLGAGQDARARRRDLETFLALR